LGKVGPYSDAELRQLHLNGILKPDTLLTPEDGGATLPFQQYWAQRPKDVKTDTWESLGRFTQGAREDLKALVPHLLVPWDELRSLRWLDNRRQLAIAAVGLVPLIILVLFGNRGQLRSAYWALAFYFSALWAVFFYQIFNAPRVTLKTSATCFFATGVVSIALLLLAYRIPPLSWIMLWTQSPEFFVRWLGYVLGVGMPEEACKALVLFLIWRKAEPFAPQTMLFYGLMSGLGFGVYEGVDYQLGRNVQFSDTIGEYYLLNVLRLTSLPFLHAIWSGIAGYFLGFALLHPSRQRGLFIVAVGLPALLHGTYDAASSSVIRLGVALFSVLALQLYLAKSVELEKAVAGSYLPESSKP